MLLYALSVRWPAVKIAFNASINALAVTCALPVYGALVSGSSVVSPRGALAAVVALLVAELVTHFCVILVVGITQGKWSSIRSAPVWLMLLLESGLDIALGLAAVYVYWSSVTSGIILLLLAIAMGTQYTLYGRLRLRHERLQKLYEFERSLASMVESDQVVAAVLSEALKLLGAEFAQLVVSDEVDGADGMTYTLRAGETAPSGVRGPHPLVDRMGTTITELLVPAGTGDPELRSALEACGFRDAIALALRAYGAEIYVADQVLEDLGLGGPPLDN